MKLSSVNCPSCGKPTHFVWGANPAERKELLCPACFSRRTNSAGPAYPFALYCALPDSSEGVWHHRRDIQFNDIARLIEASLQAGSEGSSLSLDRLSIQELLRQLYDYLLDTTAVPHWRSQIEWNDSYISKSNLKPIHVAELQARTTFLQHRIEQALLASDAELALRQLCVLERLKRRFAAWCRGEKSVEEGLTIIEVNWELLEPSGDGWRQLVHYYDSLHEFRHAERDDLRLRFLFDFKPDMLFVGRSGFAGYVVFIYQRGNIAVLESAFVGNALYTMPAKDWRELSKLSKSKLLENPPAGVKREIHSSVSFKRRLRRLLGAAGVS